MQHVAAINNFCTVMRQADAAEAEPQQSLQDVADATADFPIL